AEVLLVLVGLDLEDALPHAALLQDVDRQVVEVHLAHRDAVLSREPGLDPLLRLRHCEGRLGGVRIDEERNLVAEALHLEEALAAEDGEQMPLLLVQVGRLHQAALLVGKKRTSLGARSLSKATSRSDRTAG